MFKVSLMRASFFGLFAMLLEIGRCLPSGGRSMAPPDPPGRSSPVKENQESKKTPFQETAESMLGGSALPLIEFWHLPHFHVLEQMQGRVWRRNRHPTRVSGTIQDVSDGVAQGT
jgi:hypothetical protein